MKSGLYKVAFRTPLGQGTGVVFLDSGRVNGGDAAMYYVGSYSEDGNSFTANLAVKTHSQIGVTTVFGRDNVSIDLRGSVKGDKISAAGTSPQAPGIQFQADLTLLSG